MLEPTLNEAHVQAAVALAREIYRLHEAGLPYLDEVASLAAVTGQDVTGSDVDGAFGSMSPEDWAQDLLCLALPLPQSLSRGDLVEMARRLCSLSDAEWLQHWYIRCLEHATGCETIIDILDSPEDLNPEQIVEEALRSKRRVLITPPPKSGT